MDIFKQTEMNVLDALSNGDKIYLDMDKRPHLNFQGVFSIRVHGEWKPVCENEWNDTLSNKTAESICQTLGFSRSEYFNLVSFKYNVQLVFDPPKYSNSQGRVLEVSHEVVDPQLKRSASVSLPIDPHQKCKALFVRCAKDLTTLEDSLQNSLKEASLGNVKSSGSETRDLYLTPWTAKIYLDGEFVCSGILVDLSWVLVEQFCASFINLETKYTTVIVGSKQSLIDIQGPYEQIIRVDSIKNVTYATVSLLHLENPACYSRYVKHLPMPKFDMLKKGEDDFCMVSVVDEGKDLTIFLKPVKEQCGLISRCFNPIYKTVCKQSYGTYFQMAAWSGIVVCHRATGWYPAASFNEPRGECGFRETLNFSDLAYRSPDIKSAIENKFPKLIGAPPCNSLRCKMGQCLSMKNICDGVKDCIEGVDEHSLQCDYKWRYCKNNRRSLDCGCPISEMPCKNGLCISKSQFNDGNYDCQEGEDEPLKKHCINYIHRSNPRRICDGIIHCKDKSDEDPNICKCHSKNSVPCRNSHVCVSKDAVCDGENDCPEGDDESFCLAVGNYNVMFEHVEAGVVLERKYGLWSKKCFDKSNFSKLEIEEICREIGYTSGQLLGVSDNTHKPFDQVITDSFSDVAFKKTVISVRNSDKRLGYYKAVKADMDNSICYSLFIECH